MSRCPVGEVSGNITFSPWGKISSVWRVRNKLLDLTPDNVLPAYMCLDCLACRENCDHMVDVPSNLAAARVEFAGSLPPLTLSSGEDSPVSGGGSSGGLLGLLRRKVDGRRPKAGKELPAENSPEHDPEAAWRFLASIAPSWRKVDECQALLIPGPEMLQEDCAAILEAIFKVLEAVGDKVVGVNRHSVLECGHLNYAHGRFDRAKEEARAARKKLGRYSRLLFASPHCASFVRLKWPAIDLDRSKQASTLLEFVGKRFDFSNPGFFPRKVAYHDPCHLGRHLGLYQLPRDILKWACDGKPVELLYSRNRAVCCGGGYPLSSVAPETAEAVTGLLVEQFDESEAEVIVTACPVCTRQLRTVAPQITTMHLMEVMAEMKK